MRDRVAYLHLPKAAGTSVAEAIAQRFPPADVAPWRFDRHLLGDFDDWGSIRHPVFRGDPADLATFRLAVGHFTLHTLRGGFADGDIAFVMREPRARLLSQYAYWRSWPEEAHLGWGTFDAARAAELPLGEFARLARIAHVTDNLAIRLLVSPHPLVPAHEFIAAEDLEEVVSTALRRVDALGYVDLLERGAELFDGLADWLGAPLEVGRRNVTEHDDEAALAPGDLVAAGVLEAVHDRSAGDLAVWHHIATRVGIHWTDARRSADSAAIRRYLALVDAPVGNPATTVVQDRPEPRRFLRRR